MIIDKACLGCGEVKLLDQFHYARLGKGQRASKCKTCTSDFWKEYNARPDVKVRKKPRADAYNKKWREENPTKARKAYADWKKTHPSAPLGKGLRRALRRRPTENHVTVKELVAIWHAQEGKCALSGVEMTWGLGAYFPTSISIDRIDSSQGYTKENVRLLCYAVNAMKGVWGDDHVIEISRGIVAKANGTPGHPHLKLVVSA